MSPNVVTGTGTCHTVETVERGWEGNCLGDTTLQKSQKMPPVHTPCYDPQAHRIPTRGYMCRHLWLPGERKHSLLHLIAFKYSHTCTSPAPDKSLSSGQHIFLEPLIHWIMLYLVLCTL